LDFDEASGLGLALSHFVIADPEAGVQAWHTGATNEYVSAMVVFPAHGFGVSVLANSQGAARATSPGANALS
jgi:CubicO group peptidase (beta-lactamase class C family)